jgi:DMSO/TMAO reductase YedYZ heme-binding membrane subunit
MTATTDARAASRRGSALEGWPLVGWAALLLVALCGMLLAAHGSGEEGLRVVIRATARTSLALFLPAFAASSLRRLWASPLSAWLLRNRRQVGVSFAVSHFLHLAAILALASGHSESFWQGTNAATVVGGGLGYVLIAAMAATSSDAAVRRLGARRWKLLHRVGLWVVFGIFAQSYIPRALMNPYYAPAGIAVVGALGIRVAAWLRGRRRA